MMVCKISFFAIVYFSLKTNCSSAFTFTNQASTNVQKKKHSLTQHNIEQRKLCLQAVNPDKDENPEANEFVYQASQIKEEVIAVEKRANAVEERIALLKKDAKEVLEGSLTSNDGDLENKIEESKETSMKSSEDIPPGSTLEYEKDAYKVEEEVDQIFAAETSFLKDELQEAKSRIELLEINTKELTDSLAESKKLLEEEKQLTKELKNNLLALESARDGEERAIEELKTLKQEMKKEISSREEKLTDLQLEMTQQIIREKENARIETRKVQDRMEEEIQSRNKKIEEYENERSSARKMMRQSMHLMKIRIGGVFRRKKQISDQN